MGLEGGEERRKEKFRWTICPQRAKQRRRARHLCVPWCGEGGRGQTGENAPEKEIWKQKAGSEIVPEQRVGAIAASYKMHMTSSIS